MHWKIYKLALSWLQCGQIAYAFVRSIIGYGLVSRAAEQGELQRCEKLENALTRKISGTSMIEMKIARLSQEDIRQKCHIMPLIPHLMYLKAKQRS